MDNTDLVRSMMIPISGFLMASSSTYLFQRPCYISLADPCVRSHYLSPRIPKHVRTCDRIGWLRQLDPQNGSLRTHDAKQPSCQVAPQGPGPISTPLCLSDASSLSPTDPRVRSHYLSSRVPKHVRTCDRIGWLIPRGGGGGGTPSDGAGGAPGAPSAPYPC
jgi:hypothetical protein